MSAIAGAASGQVAPARSRWLSCLVPLGTAAVLAGAAGYVAANDPSAGGSTYPACLFHSATGLWCPGCGLTRGVHALLTGHPLEALGYNLFTPAVVLAAVLAMLGWVAAAWGRTPVRISAPLGRAIAVVIPSVLLAYGILRNIPAAPFRPLAP